MTEVVGKLMGSVGRRSLGSFRERRCSGLSRKAWKFERLQRRVQRRREEGWLDEGSLVLLEVFIQQILGLVA